MNNLECVSDRLVEVGSEDGGPSDRGLESFEGESGALVCFVAPFHSPGSPLSFSLNPLVPRRLSEPGTHRLSGGRLKSLPVANCWLRLKWWLSKARSYFLTIPRSLALLDALSKLSWVKRFFMLLALSKPIKKVFFPTNTIFCGRRTPET